MMFGFGSFNLINEFERASNEPNAEQLYSVTALPIGLDLSIMVQGQGPKLMQIVLKKNIIVIFFLIVINKF